MAYNPNIPQPGDLISISQGDILANFQAIKTLIDINHEDFASANAGKHKFLTMTVQAPAPVFAVGEIGVFSFLSAVTGVNELNITNSAGTTTPFSASLQNPSGWSYLPSGVLLKWGNSGTIAGANAIVFPVAANIPVFNNIFQVIISTKVAGAGDSFVILNSFTTLQMNVFSTQRTANVGAVSGFTWLAIGN